MNNTFDIGIVGAGLAGTMAALKISKENKKLQTVIFDLGRPPSKRRRALEGWFGVFPNSDGKLYLNDIKKVAQHVGNKKAKTASTWVLNYFSSLLNYKVQEDRELYVGLDKKIKKHGFEYHLNDLIQLYPKDIHILSRDVAERVEKAGNVTFSFDNEVFKVFKEKNMFTVTTAEGDFHCKRLIVCVGRSGWRWVTDLYNTFGIIENNDIATYGIYGEISSSYMKDFNKSNCSIFKEGLEIGPMSWNGSIIPEDHLDLAIAAFRSNENRWKTEKVAFQIIGHQKFENKGFEQTSRLGKLAFVLANDRISKERISTIIGKKSKVSIIPEYDFLINACKEIDNIIPQFINKGYFHIPTIMPLPPKVKLGNNLSTEIDGLYVAGESSGTIGLLSAALTGSIVADTVCK